MEIRYGDIRNSTVSDNATVSVTPRFIRDCPFTTGHDLTGMSTSPFAVRSTVVESPRYVTTRTGMMCASVIVYHFGYSKFYFNVVEGVRFHGVLNPIYLVLPVIPTIYYFFDN